jgi:hypothetical protein
VVFGFVENLILERRPSGVDSPLQPIHRPTYENSILRPFAFFDYSDRLLVVAAHVGERGEAAAAVETQASRLDEKIIVQAHKVADLDRRLGQIDTTIEEAAKRGRTKTALSAIEGQRNIRGELTDERNREAARGLGANPSQTVLRRLSSVACEHSATP